MKTYLMTLAVLGAVTATARAQEEPSKPTEPPAAKPVTEPPNLKFGIYGIADIALLYCDNILNNPADPAAGKTGYLT